MEIPNYKINEIEESARESSSLANNVRLSVVVDMTTSATPIPNKIQTEI
jgi:hypothetical protein